MHSSRVFTHEQRQKKESSRSFIHEQRQKKRVKSLHNAAHTTSGQPLGRKASYIHIARDDFHRLDLFKQAQFLSTPHIQISLLRLRTQATSYISTHLHLSNTHTYTPYAE